MLGCSLLNQYPGSLDPHGILGFLLRRFHPWIGRIPAPPQLWLLPSHGKGADFGTVPLVGETTWGSPNNPCPLVTVIAPGLDTRNSPRNVCPAREAESVSAGKLTLKTASSEDDVQ